MRIFSLLMVSVVLTGCSVGKSTVLVPYGSACKSALEVELVRYKDALENKRRPPFTKEQLIKQFDTCDAAATVISAVPTMIVVGASAYAICIGEGKCGSDD